MAKTPSSIIPPVPTYYQDPKRRNRIDATHQYEDIGEVNLCALELNAYDSLDLKPVVKDINVDNLNNGELHLYSNLRRDAFPPPSRQSLKSKGSCWFTSAIVIFMIVSSASLAINVLVIKGVIVTPGCSKRGQ